MSNEASIPWFSDFLGIAYRYYDLRMNVVPLFDERKQAANIWHETIHWWNDHSIKIRFVESEDKYWFVMGGDSSKPQSNKSFFKILDKSANYERFKKGHEGEAFLRLGTYTKKASPSCPSWPDWSVATNKSATICMLVLYPAIFSSNYSMI